MRTKAQELVEASEKATEAPWRVGYRNHGYTLVGNDITVAKVYDKWNSQLPGAQPTKLPMEDADFIAMARNNSGAVAQAYLDLHDATDRIFNVELEPELLGITHGIGIEEKVQYERYKIIMKHTQALLYSMARDFLGKVSE